MSHHVLMYRLFDPLPIEYGSPERFGDRHSRHCWARINWGDGECECGLLEREEIASTISFQDSSAKAPIHEDSWAQRYLEWRVDQGHFE